MILILSHPDDYHARIVAHFVRELGVPVIIADTGELGEGAELTIKPRDPSCSTWRRKGGLSFHLGEVSAVWVRRYQPPVAPADVIDPRARDFIAHQWTEMMHGLFGALNVPLINDPLASRFATKPRQLIAASRLGIATPDTLITNSATDAMGFACRRDRNVVHKTLRPALGPTLATKAWDHHDEEALPELILAPAIFQERIDGAREVRVTVVGERMFAASHQTQLVDGRLDLAAPYEPHTLPAALEATLHDLVRGLRLSYASIDLRCDRDGKYVFLEITPQGQFLWIQIHTGLPIAEAMASLLVEAARTGTPLPIAGPLPMALAVQPEKAA